MRIDKDVKGPLDSFYIPCLWHSKEDNVGAGLAINLVQRPSGARGVEML